MKSKIIALIGLGYVGLPLAVEFGKKRKVIGFDINQSRVNDLKNSIDTTLETTLQELKDAIHLSYTTNLEDVKDCEIYIVTVPTPIDKHKRPDLTPLEKSSESVGSILKKGDIVIRVNQRKVKNSSQLRNYIAEAGAWADVTLEVIREGKTEIIKVTLDELKSASTSTPLKTQSSLVLGILVQDLSPDVVKRLGYDPGTGVVITEVESGSPAAQVGLKAGMVIAEVNRQPVRDEREFQNALKNININQGVLLLMVSPQGSQYIIIKLR